MGNICGGRTKEKKQMFQTRTSSSDSVQFIGPNRRYRVDGQVGRGNFGSVCKCHDMVANESVAIKFIQRGNDLDAVYVSREILNHRILCHPHVVNFKGVFVSNTHLCIVMNFVEGGTLRQHVKDRGCLKEDWARWFFQQLIIAVEYCHRKNVVMRDIKLENILLDKDQTLIKLCDFGFSKNAVMHTKPNTKLGTPSYLAPEILMSEKQYDGEKVDIWTCGVTLYHMLFGSGPIPTAKAGGRPLTTTEMLERITKEEIEIPTHQQRPGRRAKEVSAECRDLLSKLLVKSPAGRIALPEIKQHPWFMHELPEGSLEYNTGTESVDVPVARNLQSEEEIVRLVRQAASHSQ
ncbi:hypothetical protein BSKO_05934 [Bryopsis sp. KO-2023]|nr:hypothetical protein BSKO_05934 [Bryopsis sp. KO-2023]